MKLFIFLIVTCLSASTYAQNAKTEVLTLGTFHFAFPNLDVTTTDKEDQIDVLQSQYQKEIELIVEKISRFKPTVIAIERSASMQQKTDSTFQLYLQGKYKLSRNEEEQIGFRLARKLGIRTLHCVDEMGNFTPKLDSIVFGKDSVETTKFETYFLSNPDSNLFFHSPIIFKKEGILAALKQANMEKNIKQSLGNYFIGLFKYESTPGDFIGVDFETGRWFSRNLKIYRNIQRIATNKNDRILIIYGAGHLNLLNYFFECSAEFSLANTTDYLKD